MGGMGGMGGGGGISQEQAMAFMQTAQGRQLIDQMAANPQQFLQMLPPEARNSPEILAMVQNPALLRERLREIVMQTMMQQGGGPGDGGGPLVPRDIFDLGMDALNGGEIPPQFRFEIRFQGPDGQVIPPSELGGGGLGGGLAAAVAPGGGGAVAGGEELITRAQINAALDVCVQDGLIPDAPPASGGTADDARSDAGLSDAATAGSAVGSVADVAENMELEEPPAEMDVEASAAVEEPVAVAPPGGMDVDVPPHQYAAQLAQLKEMGFDNEQVCINALEAAGGDVQTALAFLS
jgi:hypothetical protein